MLKLIKNIRVFRDGAWKPSELLMADKRIAAVDDRLDCRLPGLEILDGRGMRAIPGYIDQHVHITGGGGEGGFSNQVPPLRFSAPVKAGVTTLVGLLGTAGTARSAAAGPRIRGWPRCPRPSVPGKSAIRRRPTGRTPWRCARPCARGSG